MGEKNESKNISEDIKNLVIARLETIPPYVSMSIGGEGSFTIKELIKRVERQDEIGIKIIEMQLAYLRSLGRLPTQELQNASVID